MAVSGAHCNPDFRVKCAEMRTWWLSSGGSKVTDVLFVLGWSNPHGEWDCLPGYLLPLIPHFILNPDFLFYLLPLLPIILEAGRKKKKKVKFEWSVMECSLNLG